MSATVQQPAPSPEIVSLDTTVVTSWKAPIAFAIFTLLALALAVFAPQDGDTTFRLSTQSDLIQLSEITVPTPFLGKGLIWISSGYSPVQPIYAVRPGAKGDISLKDSQTRNDAIAWSKTRGGPYMPTPIVYGDYLYTCANSGLVTCYEAQTGKQLYAERLGRMFRNRGSETVARLPARN